MNEENSRKTAKNNPIPNNKPFPKGVSGNPNGRPRKYVTTLKAIGYKNSEIMDTVKVMVSMTESELSEIETLQTSTILEKTIATALKTSLSDGNLNSIEILLNRAYGKPKESIDIKQETNLSGSLDLTLEEEVEIINNLRKKIDSGS